jgi:hypothetical protein
MKNIHILPTDKPSRLFDFMTGLILLKKASPNDSGTNQNIYITSDKEIKVGDYIIELDGNEVFRSKRVMGKNDWCKKIILTTDDQLIKDGVQSIDDEFLEWFVKNPSCEYVEVEREKSIGYTEDRARVFYGKYKIIIPKEEPNYNGKQEILWISNNPQCKQIESCSKSLSKKCICPKEEPKQETLEEVAERYYIDNIFCDGITDFEHDIAIRCYIAGAKDQAEKMYSEEDLREAFKQSRQAEIFEKNMPPVYESFEEWFEQFKKK